DSVLANGSSLDLSSTTLSGIEKIGAGAALNTTLTITGTPLGSLNIIGGGNAADTLVVKSTVFDVSSVTLDGLHIRKAGLASATTFTVDESQFSAKGGDVKGIIGSSGSDTLTTTGIDFDLSATTLTSVERLIAGHTGDTFGTVFTL